MRLRMVILLPLLLLLVGCGSTKLYVIDKQDIYVVPKNSCLGNDRDGYFLSNMYMEKVVEAKVKR
jgi:hypothetical protein